AKRLMVSLRTAIWSTSRRLSGSSARADACPQSEGEGADALSPTLLFPSFAFQSIHFRGCAHFTRAPTCRLAGALTKGLATPCKTYLLGNLSCPKPHRPVSTVF